MLLLNMFDVAAVHKVVLPALARRLAEEEVWAQTVWPEGETVLTDHILANAGDLLQELESLRDEFLADWRR